jgi:hypothetical protein
MSHVVANIGFHPSENGHLPKISTGTPFRITPVVYQGPTISWSIAVKTDRGDASWTFFGCGVEVLDEMVAELQTLRDKIVEMEG